MLVRYPGLPAGTGCLPQGPEGFEVRGMETRAEKVATGITPRDFCHSPGAGDHVYGSSSYIRNYDFVGLVKDYNPVEKGIDRAAQPLPSAIRLKSPGRKQRPFLPNQRNLWAEEGTPQDSSPSPATGLGAGTQTTKPYDLVRRIRVEGQDI